MAQTVIIRADDLGYSPGVNTGIAAAVAAGSVGCVSVLCVPGLWTEEGLASLAGRDVALGVHSCISNGRPAAGAAAVPALVNETGAFRSSRFYRSAEQDPVPPEQALAEIRAQVAWFTEHTSRRPDYLDIHAVPSKSLSTAAEQVAAEMGLPFLGFGIGETHAVGRANLRLHLPPSHTAPYDPWAPLAGALDVAPEDTALVHVTHPGYVDAPLLRRSGLTENRAWEAEMLCSAELPDWLANRRARMTDLRAIL